MKRRAISLALAAAIAAAALTGCGGGGAAASQPAGSSPGVSQADTNAPVTLRFCWWGDDSRHKATLQAIDKYHELHPNVTIEGEYQGYDGYEQKLMTQISGKTEPDLMQLDYVWYPDLSGKGDVFVNLTTADKVDLTSYPKSMLEDYCSMDGKVIALPMGTNGFGMMINKKFFEKHNIPLDTEWTWDKVIETGEKIHKEAADDYLFSIDSGTATGGIGTFVLTPYIYTKTGKYWADEKTYKIQVTKQDFADAFTMLKKLFDSGAAQPLGEANLFNAQMYQNPKWLNAQMGFTLNWSGTINAFKQGVGAENFAVAKPPFADGGANQEIPTKPSMILAVSSRSKNVDAATEFANWMMTDPEAVKILGTQRSVPTSQVAYDTLVQAKAIDTDVAKMVEFSSKAPASPVPLIQGNAEVGDIVKDICEQVIYGKLTPDAAADQFMSSVQAKLDTLKAAQ